MHTDYCPEPTSEDYAAQPSLSTQAATTDCVQRDEAGSCDQRAEHAAPQANHQEEVTETTNVEVHVPRSVQPYVTKRGRDSPPS